MHKIFFILTCLFIRNLAMAQTADFTAPDTVCVGAQVSIVNQSTGASSYFWQFCNSPTLPVATFSNIGNPSGALKTPVFTVPVKDGNNYYVFCVNHINAGNTPGNLLRFDYGTSILNTPIVTNLGSLGAMPIQSEQLEIKKDGNNWYGILVGGGELTTPRLVIINFGTSLSNNAPTAINRGNVGGMNYPIGLHVFTDATNSLTNNWYAYVMNRLNSTITRISFGTSLANVPTGFNLSNIGNLSYPTTARFIMQGNNWHAFVSNYGNNTITRLDFGTSLINIPTGTNLGNPGNSLTQPSDMFLYRTCDQLSGYVTNNGGNLLVKIDFSGGVATGTITPTALGNLGSFVFPHSISEPVRMGDVLYSFIPNALNNTMTVMAQPSCTLSGIPSSTQTTPPVYSYSTPGTYTITLNINEGTSMQATMCKKIVVIPALPTPFDLPDTALCSGKTYTATAPAGGFTYLWSDGSTARQLVISSPGTYWLTITNRCGLSFTDTFRLTATQTVVSGINVNAIGNVKGAVGTSIALCTGTLINFVTNIVEGGSNPSYQWYKNNVAIPGATAANYATSTLANNDIIWVYLYSSEACVAVQPQISNTITWAVYPYLVPQVYITSNPSPPVLGQPVTFTATSVNGGTQPSYLWLKNGLGIPGTNNANYTTSSLRAGDAIQVRFESSYICPSPSAIVYSNTISMPLSRGSIMSVGKGSASLYPNPVTDELSIDFSEVPEDASLYLFDGTGRAVISMQQLKEGHQQINMRNLSSGIYTYNLIVKGEVYRGKIVKQ